MVGFFGAHRAASDILDDYRRYVTAMLDGRRAAQVLGLGDRTFARATGSVIVQGGRGPRESKYAQLPIAPIGVIPTRYYVSMRVKDLPGVFAAVATEFGKRGVSIAEVRQEGMADGAARIVVVTHRATDAALSETVSALADLDVVDEVTSVLRLEGTTE